MDAREGCVGWSEVAVVGRDTMYRSGICSVFRGRNVRVAVFDLIVPKDFSPLFVLVDPPLNLVERIGVVHQTAVMFVLHGPAISSEALVKAGASGGCSIEAQPDIILSLLKLSTMNMMDIFILARKRASSAESNFLDIDPVSILQRSAALNFIQSTSASLRVSGGLTEKETTIMTELVKGSSNKIIAHRLQLQEATVKTHMRSIFKKLKVTSRAGAALKWSERISA